MAEYSHERSGERSLLFSSIQRLIPTGYFRDLDGYRQKYSNGRWYSMNLWEVKEIWKNVNPFEKWWWPELRSYFGAVCDFGLELRIPVFVIALWPEKKPDEDKKIFCYNGYSSKDHKTYDNYCKRLLKAQIWNALSTPNMYNVISISSDVELVEFINFVSKKMDKLWDDSKEKYAYNLNINDFYTKEFKKLLDEKFGELIRKAKIEERLLNLAH